MIDREKMIKGLEICSDDTKKCHGCPYLMTDAPRCWDVVMKDALELLKGQEPVEPIPYDLDTPVTTVMRCYKCGWCNADITAGNPYCWHCGRKVKWDAQTD